MEKSIENVIKKIQQLKIESEKLRSIKHDVLEFRRKKLSEKESTFDSSKQQLLGCFSGYSNSQNKYGYLEIVLDCYDKLLEKEDLSIRYIYDKYRKMIEETNNADEYDSYGNRRHHNRNYSNQQLSSRFKEIIKLKDEIFQIKQVMQEEETIQSKKTISVEEIKEELEKGFEEETEIHLAAIDNSKEWHERDVESKVNEKIKLILKEKGETIQDLEEKIEELEAKLLSFSTKDDEKEENACLIENS